MSSLAYSDDAMSSPVCTTSPLSNALTTSVSFSGRVLRPERLEDRRLHDAVEHLLLAAVVDGLELDLARGAGDQRVEVADPRHDLGLAVAQRAPRGVGDERLVVGDREPHRHAGTLVDVRRATGLLAHLGDDLGHERRAPAR